MKRVVCFLTIILITTGLYSTVTIKSIKYYTSKNYVSDTGFQSNQSIKIGHTNEAEDFFITISGGQYGTVDSRRAEDWSGKGIEYFLYNNATDMVVIKDLTSNPTQSEVLSGYFNSGNGSQNIKFIFAMPPGLFPEAGHFSDTVTVTLYSGTISNYTLVESVNIQFAIQVANIIDVSIVPIDSDFNVNSTAMTLDFGILTSGTKRSADIVVQSNLSYQISLTSSNGGLLKRTDIWEPTGIPYICTVDGNVVVLPSWQAVNIISDTATPVEGKRNRLEITIGDFWDVTSGTFEDNITITVSAL